MAATATFGSAPSTTHQRLLSQYSPAIVIGDVRLTRA